MPYYVMLHNMFKHHRPVRVRATKNAPRYYGICKRTQVSQCQGRELIFVSRGQLSSSGPPRTAASRACQGPSPPTSYVHTMVPQSLTHTHTHNDWSVCLLYCQKGPSLPFQWEYIEISAYSYRCYECCVYCVQLCFAHSERKHDY